MLANVLDVIDSRVNPSNIERPATMRMKTEIESDMVRKFEDWKEHIINLRRS